MRETYMLRHLKRVVLRYQDMFFSLAQTRKELQELDHIYAANQNEPGLSNSTQTLLDAQKYIAHYNSKHRSTSID